MQAATKSKDSAQTRTTHEFHAIVPCLESHSQQRTMVCLLTITLERTRRIGRISALEVVSVVSIRGDFNRTDPTQSIDAWRHQRVNDDNVKLNAQGLPVTAVRCAGSCRSK